MPSTDRTSRYSVHVPHSVSVAMVADLLRPPAPRTLRLLLVHLALQPPTLALRPLTLAPRQPLAPPPLPALQLPRLASTARASATAPALPRTQPPLAPRPHRTPPRLNRPRPTQHLRRQRRHTPPPLPRVAAHRRARTPLVIVPLLQTLKVPRLVLAAPLLIALRARAPPLAALHAPSAASK